MLRDEFDAIFVGALGDPRVPDNRHARDILLGTRFELDLYVNYRPVRLLDDRLCPLKDRTPQGHQLRRLSREHRRRVRRASAAGSRPGTDDEVAIQEEINTFKGVNRIIRHAFEYAQANGLTKVCMADKSNAMQQGHALWQRVFKQVAREYPAITATHMYIDALAMFLVKDPGQFQVIVTNNLFGDIITDIGGALQGGLGMAASGNIHPGPDVAVRAGARLGAAAGGQERRQSDGRDPVGGADARDARVDSDEAAAIERAVEARRARRPDDGGYRRHAGHARSRRLDCDCQRPACSRPAAVRADRIRSMAKDVFILGGARTPMTEYIGALKDVSALELGAIAARGAFEKTGVKPEWIDHAVVGNVLQTSSDAIYGARHVALKAGVPIEVPALTVNRLCGSGIQAAVSGAQLIQLDEAEHRARPAASRA